MAGEPPILFDAVEAAAGLPPLTLAVPPHHSVAILGDESVGVGRLGGYVLGLELPRTGRVRVFGTAIAELPPRDRLAFRRRLGYLPAGDGLVHNLSLRDNVALPLRFGSTASAADIDGRVNVMLAHAGLDRAADLRPAQATDEQRRRAALARAMAFDPALLVLEHPFDGVASRTAAELLELARGGEVEAGGRRTILLMGPELPDRIARRVEAVYRLTREGLMTPERV